MTENLTTGEWLHVRFMGEDQGVLDYALDRTAKVCHEANRALRAFYDNPDEASPSWEDAGEEQQRSVIDGVRSVLAGATPEESHGNWLKFKEEHGWVYGPVKDEVAKTHPCFLPYADLPVNQRIKDHVFGAIVRAMA